MSKRFIDKIRFKYKISILNENTFEEKLNFRISALNIALVICFSTIISFTLISLIIFLTPIKIYLPGFADVSVKGELIKESLRVDSLKSSLEAHNRQFDMLKLIIRNEMPLDSVATADSLTLASWADLPLEKTENEKLFASEYEKDAKYNLSTIDINSSKLKANSNFFIRPADGVVIDSIKNQNNGISIATTNNASVIAINKGTIIHTSLSHSNGYMVMIQHNNGFISIYNNIERLLKQENDHLNTGEVFAFMGKKKKNNKTPLSFELWLNGEPQKPTDYIVF